MKIDPLWQKYADEDYKVIISILSADDKLHRSICFHAQQFVEKILKGIIKANGKIPPKTHDIGLLLSQCSLFVDKIDLTDIDAAFLSSIYIDFRYPTDHGLLPDGEPLASDSDYALRIVRKLKKMARRKLIPDFHFATAATEYTETTEFFSFVICHFSFFLAHNS